MHQFLLASKVLVSTNFCFACKQKKWTMPRLIRQNIMCIAKQNCIVTCIHSLDAQQRP